MHVRTAPDVQLVCIVHCIFTPGAKGNGHGASSLTILVGTEQSMEIGFQAKALLLLLGQVSCLPKSMSLLYS